MKKLLGVLVLGLMTLGLAPMAEARGHHDRVVRRVYVEYYRPYDCPVWIETYVDYYDHCGRPVYAKRIIRVAPPCRPRPECYVPPRHCEGPIRYSEYRPRVGVSFEFGNY